MAYVFEGSSEANSARNSHRDRGQGLAGSRQRRREQSGHVGGGGGGVGGSEGVYFGTGRFYEENLRNELQQQQRQREREDQQTPRYRSSGGTSGGGLNGSGFSAGAVRSKEEWGRLVMEVLRRAGDRSRQERGGGGPGPQGLGADEENRFEDLFGGVFGTPEGGTRGDGGGAGMFGAGAGGPRSFGFFGGGGGGGGGGTSFEGVFGSPGHLPGRTEYDPGTGFGFEDQGDVRRGGAGMTWAEFTELFRHRYAGGATPADLFDSWHTDW